MKVLTSDRAKALISNAEVFEGSQSTELPVISICIATYNHEDYIDETINSVLRQVVSCKYEIIIGDDNSTDKTREILRAYQKRYPEIIRLIFSEENLGKYTGNGCLNKIRLIEAAKGDYFAFLDGDDYWTCDHKLDMQMKILNNNEKYIMCCHDALILNEKNGENFQILGETYQRDISIYDYISGTPCDSSTYIFRNVNVDLFKPLILNLHAADWALYLTYSQLGDTFHTPDCMSVWRIHRGGICGPKKLSESYWKKLNSYPIILDHFPEKYHDFIRAATTDTYIRFIASKIREEELPLHYNSYVKIFNKTSKLIPNGCSISAKNAIAEKAYKEYFRGNIKCMDLKCLVRFILWSRPSDIFKHVSYIFLYYTRLIKLVRN